MIEALDGIEEGVLVGGVLLKDIKFVDDQAMVHSSEDGLQKMMDSLDVTGRRYDMKIRTEKFGEITCLKPANWQITNDDDGYI